MNTKSKMTEMTDMFSMWKMNEKKKEINQLLQ